MRRNTLRNAMAAFGLAVGLNAAPAGAQIIITGHHDNHTTGNGYGYAAYNGSYAVPADTGTALDATFNGNAYSGLNVYDATVAVAGGQFDGNGGGSGDGMDVTASTAAVTGGQFDGNYAGIDFTSYDGLTGAAISGGSFDHNQCGLQVDGGLLTVSGGSFTNNAQAAVFSTIVTLNGVTTSYGAVTVTGGQFAGNACDFFTSKIDTGVSTIDIYGSFTDPSTGRPLVPGQTFSLPAGAGTFTGTLADNAAAQSYTYDNPGAITLHGVAPAPEPSQFAALGVGLLGLGGLAFRARRQVGA